MSFDLVNEPPKMRPWEGYLEERYEEVVRALVAGIREEDPNRLIVADSVDIGQLPVPGLADLGIVQSTRGYQPKAVSHYTATWVPPGRVRDDEPADVAAEGRQGRRTRKTAQSSRMSSSPPGRRSRRRASPGCEIGEFGCFNKTPHDVALAWLGDLLSLWKEAGWGFSMWELRGAFGVLDSQRADVAYEDYKGHKLDRKLLVAPEPLS
ncbi:MAG: hypothetical protein U0599_27180 [Vicinamibacteria bacterium]